MALTTLLQFVRHMCLFPPSSSQNRHEAALPSSRQLNDLASCQQAHKMKRRSLHLLYLQLQADQKLRDAMVLGLRRHNREVTDEPRSKRRKTDSFATLAASSSLHKTATSRPSDTFEHNTFDESLSGSERFSIHRSRNMPRLTQDSSIQFIEQDTSSFLLVPNGDEGDEGFEFIIDPINPRRIPDEPIRVVG